MPTARSPVLLAAGHRVVRLDVYALLSLVVDAYDTAPCPLEVLRTLDSGRVPPMPGTLRTTPRGRGPSCTASGEPCVGMARRPI
jgi:hypothetical protein